jgi:hypothetical protein
MSIYEFTDRQWVVREADHDEIIVEGTLALLRAELRLRRLVVDLRLHKGRLQRVRAEQA